MSVKNSLKERTISKVKEPRHYNVVMMNDDFTTMEFVVAVLIDIFRKDEVSAQTIMMNVHKNEITEGRSKNLPRHVLAWSVAER